MHTWPDGQSQGLKLTMFMERCDRRSGRNKGPRKEQWVKTSSYNHCAVLYLHKSIPTAKHRMNHMLYRSLGTSSSPSLYDPASRWCSEGKSYWSPSQCLRDVLKSANLTAKASHVIAAYPSQVSFTSQHLIFFVTSHVLRTRVCYFCCWSVIFEFFCNPYFGAATVSRIPGMGN